MWGLSKYQETSFHPLVKNMYIMAVFSSSDLYSCRVSVIEWVKNKLLCHKFIHEVWFSNYFIIGPLKMRPNLLAEKYTYRNSNIGLNVSWSFSPQLGAFDSHQQAFNPSSLAAFSQALRSCVCTKGFSGSKWLSWPVQFNDRLFQNNAELLWLFLCSVCGLV